MTICTPLRLSTLLFIQDQSDRFLLLERTKAPNAGLWSPPGGKVEMALGESPFECARREAHEEVGLVLADADLHLFGMITEKAFEGQAHWLLFLFHCKLRISVLPPTINEGRFGLFSRDQIDTLAIAPTDKSILWPFFDKFHTGFVSARMDCTLDRSSVIIEQLGKGENDG